VTILLVGLFGFVAQLPLFMSDDGWFLDLLIPFGVIPPALATGLLLAHFLGGAVAGRMSSGSPGQSGALSAPLSVFLGIVGYVAFVGAEFLLMFGPSEFVSLFVGRDSLREVLTDEEMIGFYVLMLVLAIYIPFAALVGYVGGRLGGRLRRRSTPQTVG